jgi:hypothetical protein
MVSPVLPASPPGGVVVIGRRPARIAWFVIATLFAIAVVGTLVGTVVVAAPRDPELGRIFLLVAGIMVPIDLGIGYLLSSRLRRRVPPGAPRDATAGAQVIIGSSLALGAGLTASLFFLVAREPLLLALVLPCAAVLVHWFPSQRRWEALSAPPAPGAPPPRNPMVRG